MPRLNVGAAGRGQDLLVEAYNFEFGAAGDKLGFYLFGALAAV